MQRQDDPTAEVEPGGDGEATPLKATARSLGGEIPAAELQATIQAALPRLQERLTSDFSGQVKLTVGPTGRSQSVDIPTFTPARDFKACYAVIEVLSGLTYPAPKPEGSTAIVTFSIKIPAANKQ